MLITEHVKIIVCNIIVKYTFTWQHVKCICNVTFQVRIQDFAKRSPTLEAQSYQCSKAELLE